MNIPQAEHGGNGESGGVVNQWLLFGGHRFTAVEMRRSTGDSHASD
jgi:hypothetical protein